MASASAEFIASSAGISTFSAWAPSLGDNSRLRQVLGWEPQIKLREGLKITYLWIENELRKAKRLPPALTYVADFAYAAD